MVITTVYKQWKTFYKFRGFFSTRSETKKQVNWPHFLRVSIKLLFAVFREMLFTQLSQQLIYSMPIFKLFQEILIAQAIKTFDIQVVYYPLSCRTWRGQSTTTSSSSSPSEMLGRPPEHRCRSDETSAIRFTWSHKSKVLQTIRTLKCSWTTWRSGDWISLRSGLACGCWRVTSEVIW